MKYIFVIFSFLPFLVFAQTDNGLFERYQDYTSWQIKQSRTALKSIWVVEYNERYQRKYDSIAIAYFPSGNISSKTFYSRNSNGISYVYEYLDNQKEQISKIVGSGYSNKPVLKYSYTYTDKGMETASIYDNYGAEERKYFYKYDERGNQVEFIGTYRGNPDHDFVYEYDLLGRKTKEIHKGRGDVILFQYDFKGNKVQEIHHGTSTVEKVLLFEYDSANNLILTKVVLGGGNLRRDFNTFNSSKQKIRTVQYDAEGFIDTKLLYKYDRDGNLSDETTLRPGMQAFFSFDKQGNELIASRSINGAFSYPNTIDTAQIVVLDSIGRLTKKSWKNNYTTYIYDITCPEKLLESKTFGYKDFIYNKTSFKYNADCRVISKTSINFHPDMDYGPEKLPDTTQTFFSYDKTGNIVEEKSLRSSRELLYKLTLKYDKKIIAAADLIDNSRHKKMFYGFDGRGELNSLKVFVDDILSGDISYTYEYDQHGNWISRTATDKVNEKKFSLIERVMGE